MSELLQTTEVSGELVKAVLQQAAVDREVQRLHREFDAWQFKMQIKDERLVASILRGWGFQVGEA